MKKPSLLALMLLIGGQVFAQTISLPESVDVALQNNPRIAQARQNLNAAYSKRGEAAGNFLPNLSLSASKGNNYTQPTSVALPDSLGGGTFSILPNEASNVTSYNFTLRQTLFAGGRVLEGYAVADIGYRAAEESLRTAQDEVKLSVISAYYNLLKAQKSLAVLDESKSNLNRNLAQAQVFYDSGIGSQLDLLRIKTQLANIEISRIRTQNGIKLARLAFETALGRSASEELQEVNLDSAPSPAITQDQALSSAYANRPDWKTYTLGLEAAQRAVTVNFGNFLPSFSYVYSSGRNKIEYATSASSSSDLGSWQSMVVGSWTLFNGFQNVNQVEEARANLESAKALVQTIKDAIALEVNSDYFSLLSARENITASQTAADLADEALKNAEVSYKANILSEQNYLDAHAANQAAQLNLWSAKYDYEVAKAQLNKAIGKTII